MLLWESAVPEAYDVSVLRGLRVIFPLSLLQLLTEDSSVFARFVKIVKFVPLESHIKVTDSICVHAAKEQNSCFFYS